jgi:hypothetical protein
LRCNFRKAPVRFSLSFAIQERFDVTTTILGWSRILVTCGTEVFLEFSLTFGVLCLRRIWV